MTGIRIHKSVLFLIFLITANLAWTQNKIEVHAAVDKNKIILGEQFQLQLQVIFTPGTVVNTFKIDSIPHFEIADRKKDTIYLDGKTKIVQSFTLTSFDSGHWVLPSFYLTKKIKTDTIPVDVVFSSPFDPNQPYHDIKDVIDVEGEEKNKNNLWLYLAGGVLMLLAVIYFFARKKKPVAKVQVPVNAYKEAVAELEKLKKENVYDKLFYTKLIDIFRLYVLKKKNIASLQKTTEDLVQQLKVLKLPAEDFDLLAKTLGRSDLVKFAKYEANEEDKTNSWKTIKHSIEIIEKMNPSLAAGDSEKAHV